MLAVVLGILEKCLKYLQKKLFENQLVTNYFINILKIITKKFGSLQICCIFV
jgi:hypothetical protein